MLEKYRHKVHYYETDRMGITHHSNYIRWMEEARVDFLAKIGWSYDKMEEEGVISPVVGVDCKYKQTTTFADEVEITVKVKDFKGAKLVLAYRIENCADGSLVCLGHTEHGFLDRDGRIVRLEKEYPAFYDTLMKLQQEAIV